MDNIKNIHNTNKESVFERLADFDFSSPVQVNIIFEDEEDTSSFTPEVKIKAEKTGTKDFKKSSNKESPDKIETKNQEKKEIVPQNGSKIGSNPNTSSTIPFDGTKKNEHSNFGVELNSDKNLKRKLDDHTFTGSTSFKNVTRIDNAPGSYAFQGEQMTSTNSMFLENSPNNNIAYDNDNENADNSSTEMTCITNLLRSVSRHLILILESYIKHLQLKEKSIEPSEKERHMANFRQLKYHFFNLSFCTVDNIILPQENNLLFTGQFLNDTIKLAAAQNRTLCLETQVAPLFLELLQWSKQKKLEINKIQTVNNTSYIQSNPLLRQQLSNSAKSVNIPNQGIQYSGVHGNIQKNIYNTHPKPLLNSVHVPNRVNSLLEDLNRSVAANMNYQRLQSTIPSMVQKGSNAQHFNFNKSSTTFEEHNRFVHPPAQFKNVIYNTSANPLKAVQEPDKNLQSQIAGKTYNIPPTNTSEKPKSVVFSTGPPERRVSISVNQSLLETCGNTNNSISNNIRNETELLYYSESAVPPSYAETMIQRNQFCMQSNQYNSSNNIQSNMPPDYQRTTSRVMPGGSQGWPPTRQEYYESTQAQQAAQAAQSIPAQAEQLNPEITRSISTDSGFMSPLNFNNPLEMQNKDAVEDNTLPSPMITHVTSLHPNVSYIKEGPCSVCGKTTRKMCVGCYKRYYCSNACQRFDWSIHKAMCRNS